jgi:hypothetical protein
VFTWEDFPGHFINPKKMPEFVHLVTLDFAAKKTLFNQLLKSTF